MISNESQLIAGENKARWTHGGGGEGKEVGRDGKVWEVRSRALFFTMLQFQPSSQLFVKA